MNVRHKISLKNFTSLILVLFLFLGMGCSLGRKKSSVEVMNAFNLFNQEMTVSINESEAKCASLMTLLESKFAANPIKMEPYYRDAKKALQLTSEFIHTVQALRDLILIENGGYDEKSWELKNGTNCDIPSYLMVEKENGKQLKWMINNLRDSLLALHSLNFAADERMSFADKLPLTTEYNIVKAKYLGIKSWEAFTFDGVPVVAALAILTKIQADAWESASLIIEALYNRTSSGSYDDSNWIQAKVEVPPWLFVREKQEAKIFLAALSSRHGQMIYIGKFNPDKFKGESFGIRLDDNPLQSGYDSIPVLDGYGTYPLKSIIRGAYKVEGVIKVNQPDGAGDGLYPFAFEYRVRAPCN